MGDGVATSMVRELLYPNAPLVEVIVELHWKLQPVLGGRIGAMDPFFEVFAKEFGAWAKANGYPHEQRVVPATVPTEFLAHKALLQYRREKDKWPLYQIGPGVMTVNATPPYGGWSNFRPVIQTALDGLINCYPLAAKTLVFEKVELHYIDAFRKEHGVESPMAFLRNDLRLVGTVPESLFQFASSTEEVTVSGEYIIPLKRPNAAQGVIRFGPATVNDESALLLDFTISSKPDSTPLTPAPIQQWLEDAHDVCSTWFQSLLSARVRTALEKA